MRLWARALPFGYSTSKYLVVGRWVPLPYWLGICRLLSKVVRVLCAVGCWRKRWQLQFPSIKVDGPPFRSRDSAERGYSVCLEEYSKVSFVSARASNYCLIITHPPSQFKKSTSHQKSPRDSTSFIPVPPPPMPEYPPDWNEQNQHECYSPTRPAPVASPGSPLGAEKSNRLHNRLARHLRTIFTSCTRSPEVA